MERHRPTPLQLGYIVATPGVLLALADTRETPAKFLARHIVGDWGEVPKEAWRLNDQALDEGSRVLSSYRLSDNTRIWIITEADRSMTTLLLPSEY